MAGYLWAILSGLGFGLFQVFNKRATLVYDYRIATLGLLLISSLILVLASLFASDLRLLSDISFAAVAYFSLAGIFQFLLGWTLLTISQTKIGAPRTGALISTAPLFAVVIAIIFLQEHLNWIAMLGITMIIVGIFFVTND